MKTEEQLIQLLDDAENSVIALSGRWGTGKTHLWNKVKDQSNDEKVKNALYVSLFGLSSIDQVKRKLIEAAIPCVDSHGWVPNVIKNIFKTGVEAASKHYKALAALNNLNLLLMAPVVLRDNVIVIDDIERKHEKLCINEILGFIDEYSKQHKTRFVLVLNDDQLSREGDQSKLWTTFREKIIDHEIKLSTTADEAFTIAIELKHSLYADSIKRASITCSLTNIRIVMRVIKVTNQILAGHNLDSAVLARIVPSIVLFSAIYYRGLDDGPDFKFALNVGNPDYARLANDRNEELSPEEERSQGWRMLMQELGILACDEFEEQLVEYLESGLLEPGSIKAILDRYVEEKDAMEAKRAAKNFLTRAFWEHRISELQLVEEAKQLPEIGGFLDPFTVTKLDTVLTALPGGESISTAIIDAWITAFKASSPNTMNFENPFNNPIHPRIQSAIEEINETDQANTSIVDACIHILESKGWGTLQEVALRRATATDFETAIREIDDIETLHRFMYQMTKMRTNRASFDPHFGTATEHFVEACRTITKDSESPRLASLIQRLYKASSIESELAPQE